jgi:hypothetical protein
VTCDFLFFYFSSSVYSTLFLFISFGFATGLVTDTESQSQSLGCMRVWYRFRKSGVWSGLFWHVTKKQALRGSLPCCALCSMHGPSKT